MTHRLDSDYTWPYFEIKDIESDQIVAPSKYVQWREVDHDFFDEKLFQYAVKKRKMLMGAISHCDADSNRDILIEKIKRNIQFDLYGRCNRLRYFILLKNSWN